jgi:hypothetical protein
VAAVTAAQEPDPELPRTSVYGLSLLPRLGVGLLESTSRSAPFWIADPCALKKSLEKSGPLSREPMERIARRLDLSLPHASFLIGSDSLRAVPARGERRCGCALRLSPGRPWS